MWLEDEAECGSKIKRIQKFCFVRCLTHTLLYFDIQLPNSCQTLVLNKQCSSNSLLNSIHWTLFFYRCDRRRVDVRRFVHVDSGDKPSRDVASRNFLPIGDFGWQNDVHRFIGQCVEMLYWISSTGASLTIFCLSQTSRFKFWSNDFEIFRNCGVLT